MELGSQELCRCLLGSLGVVCLWMGCLATEETMDCLPHQAVTCRKEPGMQLRDLDFHPGSGAVLWGVRGLMSPLLSGPQFPCLFSVQVEIYLISVLVTAPAS